MGAPRLLIVVATATEAAALGTEELAADLVVSGVGPVAAALATAAALARAPYDLAVSAGIGGAYPASGLRPGDLAVSSEMIHADLGAADGEGWLDLAQLGLSVSPQRLHHGRFAAWTGAGELARRAGAAHGPLLTLSAVTGSQRQALAWAERYPGALTEGMEGAGVAHSAWLAGVPALELRGVSNPVGPRDRAAWRLPEALRATRAGLQALLSLTAASPQDPAGRLR